MARFVRGDEIFDVWLESEPDTDSWQFRCLTRDRPNGPIERSKPDAWGSRNQYVNHQLEHLESGWTRDLDPARDALFDEPTNSELDAVLAANPDDLATLLVYADWLQQRGHPRGALIATQHARAAADQPELAEAEAELFADHRDALLGSLSIRDARDKREGGFDLAWERGFIRRARLDGFHERGEAEDNLWQLLRHPSGRFLRDLEIGCHRAGDQDNTLICATLLHAGPTPPLRRLVIGDFDQDDYDGIDISRAPIGNLALLSTAYPTLEEVILKGTGGVELGALDLPRARLFAIRTSTLRASTLATITAAAWPALEELELWIGDDEYGGDCRTEHLAPLFAASKLPALRRLRIMNTLLSDEICPLLISAPTLAAQLVELDFALGTLSDAGAATLAAARDRFPALQSLNVFNCALTGSGLSRLRDAKYPVVERPPSARWEVNPRTQKPERYISDSE